MVQKSNLRKSYVNRVGDFVDVTHCQAPVGLGTSRLTFSQGSVKIKMPMRFL